MGQRTANSSDGERAAPATKKESVLSRLGDAVASTKSSSDSPRSIRTSGNSNAARVALKENAADANARTSKRQRTDSSTSNDADGAADRKKRAVAPFTQKDTMARSRRMFGALMGHLGKAKAQIERDSALFERQGSKQHDVARKEQRQATIAKLEKLIARTETERTDALARLTQAHAEQLRTGARVAGFLQTVASPPIYYLPAKHTKETADLVAAATEAHEAKQQRSARAHEAQLRERDAAFTRKLELYREQLAQARGSDVTGEASAVSTAPHEGEAVDKDASAADDDAAMAPASDSVGDTKAPVADDADGESAMEETEKTSEDDAPGATTSETPSEQPAAAAAESASADGDCTGPSDGSHEESASAADDQESVSPAAASGHPSGEGEKDTETPGTTERADDDVPSEPVAAKETAAATETESSVQLDVSALKVTELREQLKQRGLDPKGLKASLVARLEAAIEQETRA